MPNDEAKDNALKHDGVLNPHPEVVQAPLFRERQFFDPRDLVQVKYEMLRSVEVDGSSVTAASRTFGLSRPTYYAARRAFEQEGLLGLVPKRRGPRGAHKLSDEVMDFVEARISQADRISMAELALAIHEHFEVRVHPRSIERALSRRKRGA